MRHKSTLLLFLLCAGVATLAGLSQAYAISVHWDTNASGVNALSRLFDEHSTTMPVSDATMENSCGDYMATILVLDSGTFQELPSDSQFQLLERYQDCLPEERRHLLIRWISDSMWSLGQYDDACDLLVTAGSPDKLLKLAQQAAKDSNWTAVESGLKCILLFDPNGPWVSPYIVSQLYYALGEHLEQIQATTEAITAFDNSARWFPVIWSAPYTKKAALLWSQGDRTGAIDWLIDGVTHSTDVTATYNLWRELGEYWQQVGALEDAYCAYRSALGVIDQVPLQNVTALDRDVLTEHLRQLEVDGDIKCSMGIRCCNRRSDMAPCCSPWGSLITLKGAPQ